MQESLYDGFAKACIDKEYRFNFTKMYKGNITHEQTKLLLSQTLELEHINAKKYKILLDCGVHINTILDKISKSTIFNRMDKSAIFNMDKSTVIPCGITSLCDYAVEVYNQHIDVLLIWKLLPREDKGLNTIIKYVNEKSFTNDKQLLEFCRSVIIKNMNYSYLWILHNMGYNLKLWSPDFMDRSAPLWYSIVQGIILYNDNVAVDYLMYIFNNHQIFFDNLNKNSDFVYESIGRTIALNIPDEKIIMVLDAVSVLYKSKNIPLDIFYFNRSPLRSQMCNIPTGKLNISFKLLTKLHEIISKESRTDLYITLEHSHISSPLTKDFIMFCRDVEPDGIRFVMSTFNSLSTDQKLEILKTLDNSFLVACMILSSLSLTDFEELLDCPKRISEYELDTHLLQVLKVRLVDIDMDRADDIKNEKEFNKLDHFPRRMGILTPIHPHDSRHLIDEVRYRDGLEPSLEQHEMNDDLELNQSPITELYDLEECFSHPIYAKHRNFQYFDNPQTKKNVLTLIKRCQMIISSNIVEIGRMVIITERHYILKALIEFVNPDICELFPEYILRLKKTQFPLVIAIVKNIRSFLLMGADLFVKTESGVTPFEILCSPKSPYKCIVTEFILKPSEIGSECIRIKHKIINAEELTEEENKLSKSDIYNLVLRELY